MKIQEDYSNIRGFCYGHSQSKSEEMLLKELSYATRLNLNSCRIWLVYEEYWKNPQKYIKDLVKFVRICFNNGITTMPILWNGNGLNPDILETTYRNTGDQYITDIVNALKDEEGIIMWDIMNEPSCNDHILKEEDENILAQKYKKMWDFVRHYCNLVKDLDKENPITIGHTFVKDIEPTVECTDVISFHDYFSTRAAIENTYKSAKELSDKYKQPLINSEMGCLGRANPYDLALEMCEKHSAGWYLFELMIGGYWGDIHGIVYSDGTVRDPSVVAAIMGFHRNRTETAVKANANKEGYAERGIQMVKEALECEKEVFSAARKPVEGLLEAMEYCANLLECCELVPMWEPPTARINKWRREDNPDIYEIRAYAYELISILKKNCQIIDTI